MFNEIDFKYLENHNNFSAQKLILSNNNNKTTKWTEFLTRSGSLTSKSAKTPMFDMRHVRMDSVADWIRKPLKSYKIHVCVMCQAQMYDNDKWSSMISSLIHNFLRFASPPKTSIILSFILEWLSCGSILFARVSLVHNSSMCVILNFKEFKTSYYYMFHRLILRLLADCLTLFPLLSIPFSTYYIQQYTVHFFVHFYRSFSVTRFLISVCCKLQR